MEEDEDDAVASDMLWYLLSADSASMDCSTKYAREPLGGQESWRAFMAVVTSVLKLV